MTTAKPAYTASLSFSDGSAGTEFPVYTGTMGPDVIDIRKLYANTGKFTFDPGFMSTGACESAITYIDGDKGELLYRGYAIEDLAQHCDYLDVCHLLLKGELPSPQEKADFDYVVTHHTMLHEQMVRFFSGFRRDAHPMSVLVACVGALAAFYHDSLDITKEEHRHVASIRLIAKMPTLVALAYKYSNGQPFAYPRNKLSYSANFMHLMFSTPCDEYVPNEVLVRALDRILILHADHEQNASTSTVRLAGSSGANPFACIAAGIATLWGPAHGGANEAALRMLEDLLAQGGVERIGEQIALEDDYFVARKLYPNVDFYSGIVQRAMGIPTSMFTAIFAMARTVGWIAQWSEMLGDPDQKIGRPRQLYMGQTRRKITTPSTKLGTHSWESSPH